MQESELLVTTAQVAVGLAGFSGVAGVLGERRGSTASAVQGALLRNMIETSLSAAGFSLLPIVLSHIGFASEVVWRLAAGINLVAFVAQLGLTVRRGMRIIAASGGSVPRAWVAFVFAFATFIVVSLAVSTLGFSSAPLYVGALFLQLVLSGSMFVRFFALLTS